MTAIRTVIAHPVGGNLYGSEHRFRDANYNFSHNYSNGTLYRDGWRMLSEDEIARLPEWARDLTPGEYVESDTDPLDIFGQYDAYPATGCRACDAEPRSEPCEEHAEPGS